MTLHCLNQLIMRGNVSIVDQGLIARISKQAAEACFSSMLLTNSGGGGSGSATGFTPSGTDGSSKPSSKSPKSSSAPAAAPSSKSSNSSPKPVSAAGVIKDDFRRALDRNVDLSSVGEPDQGQSSSRVSSNRSSLTH